MEKDSRGWGGRRNPTHLIGIKTPQRLWQTQEFTKRRTRSEIEGGEGELSLGGGGACWGKELVGWWKEV